MDEGIPRLMDPKKNCAHLQSIVPRDDFAIVKALIEDNVLSSPRGSEGAERQLLVHNQSVTILKGFEETA